MKKIILAIAGYFLALMLLVVGCIVYIQHKNLKLRIEAYGKYNEFFSNQSKYVDSNNSNEQIKYTKVQIPQRPAARINGSLDNKYEIDEWKEKYLDIDSFFEVDNLHYGWRLFVAEKGIDGVMYTYNVYPSYVGLKQPYYSFMSYSVEQCIEEAYDFWTKNSKSQYFEYYKKGNQKKVDKFIDEVGNEYYNFNAHFFKFNKWHGEVQYRSPYDDGRLITQDLDLHKIGTAGYMYNGFYKVFADRSANFYALYVIEKNDEAIKDDYVKIIAIGIVFLTITFLIIVIPLVIKQNHKRKIENESLYETLLRKCNPANFMNPYDDVKVDKANRIYEQLLQFSDKDVDFLKKLRIQAAKELEISFVSKKHVEYLKKKCDPAQFMDPYDAGKVAIANHLYNKLSNNECDMEILENVANDINEQLGQALQNKQ